MVRLAVGIWPSPDVIAAITMIDRLATTGVRWSTPEQWIVKVRPLGHVRPALITELVDALGDALDRWPVVVCTVGPATRRLGGQWLGAPATGLDELAAIVFEVTSPIVPVTHPQPFQADIVLARGRVPSELAGHPISATWTVDSVSLVADRSSPLAPGYEDVACFRLARGRGMYDMEVRDG